VTNLLYPKWEAAQQKALTPDLSSGAVNIKAILVDLADYTYSAAHEFLSDVPGAARVAVSANLASKTVSATTGAFDAADFAFTAVTGDPSEALIFFHDTGVEGTSRLIMLLDTGVTGLPVTPNGGDINVALDPGGLFIP
jgi:hypothetical protein